MAPDFLATVGGQDLIHAVKVSLNSMRQDATAQRKALEELTAVQSRQGEALERIATSMESIAATLGRR